MTEKKNNLSEFTPFKLSSVEKIRIGIVVSEWNSHITDSLLEGAQAALKEQGIPADNIQIVHVPGSFELPSAASMMLSGTSQLNAVICLGCIIQGETRHFEFIAQAVAQGIVNVSLEYKKPVSFGVLTCDTMQQAENRAGGKYGNKGVEAAISCLKMIAVQAELDQ